MAEAIVNHHLTDSWHAESAGTEPAGYVHPLAIQALKEININHSGKSKNISELQDIDFDYVITVCDDAAENCPLWLGKGKRDHISFPDPAAAEGSKEEIMQVFRDVRDDILKRIILRLNSFDIN
jgi:arsenate reductase